MKKLISLLLACLMVFSCVSVTAFAAEEKTTYVADYDTETPIVIVHGMSQNDTYMLDEKGQRIPDDNGYVTGWPLEIDFIPLLKKALIPLVKTIITRKDQGLSQAVNEGAFEALYVLHKDNKGNYLTPVEVPCYECPMSELPQEVRDLYFSFIPLQGLCDIAGGDNVYYFGYDSFGDVISETEKLHHYIHDVVLPQTGAKQVKLCNISLGGTIGVNYLETYKEDYPLIKKMEFVVPAIDGSDIIGDLLTDNLSVYENDDMLYEQLLVTLLGDTYLAYILNMVLRILPDDVLKSVLSALAAGVVEAGILPTTIMWALCPTDYYQQARAKWLDNDEYKAIADKVDYYMNARKNFPANIAALQAGGTKVYNICCHGGGMFPLCKDYNVTNGDGIVHANSASMWATFANVGETLGENYKAVGTYCSDPTHNHISPDNTVDATTGLLPCTTWYIKGQDHEKLPQNDVVLEMAFEIMTDENMLDVYSNPEVYPQFNNGRLTLKVMEYLEAWDKADKAAIAPDKAEAAKAAAEEIEKQLDETIVDPAKWKAAEEALRVALVEAGVIEDTTPTAIESIFTQLTKHLNKGVNKVFSYINK